MEPLTGEALEARIKELEEERDRLLAETPFVRYAPCKTSHGKIRLAFNKRIGCLRKHGVENPLQIDTVKVQMIDTRKARYGSGHGNVQKMLNTKIEKYGNKSGNVQQMMATKRILYDGSIFGDKSKIRQKNMLKYGYPQGNVKQMLQTKQQKYGNAFGDIDKIQQTKLERYGKSKYNVDKCRKTNIERHGYPQGPVDKQIHTKLRKYGNAFGDKHKIEQTKLERYGNPLYVNHEQGCQTRHKLYGYRAFNMRTATQTCKTLYGVDWACQLPQCIKHNGRMTSAINKWWQSKLQQALGITFELDSFHINAYTYDLSYITQTCKLLIEVNPSFTHNSTYTFQYSVGRTNYNNPLHLKQPTYHLTKTLVALQHGFVCISIWDWDNVDYVIDIIRRHIEHLPIDSTDMSKNPQFAKDYVIHKHWHNYKTGKHIEDCGQDEQEMIDAGYVAVYDCGHAVQN